MMASLSTTLWRPQVMYWEGRTTDPSTCPARAVRMLLGGLHMRCSAPQPAALQRICIHRAAPSGLASLRASRRQVMMTCLELSDTSAASPATLVQSSQSFLLPMFCMVGLMKLDNCVADAAA